MSIAFEWKKRPDELGGGELENRQRIESVFAQVFAQRGHWTAKVLKESLLEFRVRFLDSGGNPQGPAITFSAMDGHEDVERVIPHLRQRSGGR
ncbi:hypothetical protein SBA4_2060002 [Candidatus Sulfopaludibacter sp. SbA4]|nr:hypothetical protein SBA4_2060002 [Candidatus Sulfopaludibacter sp. SbA4]